MKLSHVLLMMAGAFLAVSEGGKVAQAAPQQSVKKRDSCSSEWSQCAGINWSGATCCQSGLACIYLNDYYSQCQKSSSSSSSTTTTTSSKTTTTTTTTSTTSSRTTTTTTTSPTTSSRTTTTTTTSPTTSSRTTTTTTSPTTSSRSTTTTTTTTSSRTTTTTTTTTTSSTTTSGSSPTFTSVSGGLSGSGTTTRYWDCCKPSCGWDSNSGYSSSLVNHSALTCTKSGAIESSQNIKNVCSGGGDTGPEDGYSYMCTNNQPIVINDNLSYGFAASPYTGSSYCCACFLLTFTSGTVSGKQFLIQSTNTGGDLSTNQFDLQIPGGGLGIYDGCSQQFGVDASSWGARYGGVSNSSDCANLPSVLQAGCKWRFDWFKNADNPSITYQQVVCPNELVAISGCRRVGG